MAAFVRLVDWVAHALDSRSVTALRLESSGQRNEQSGMNRLQVLDMKDMRSIRK